MKAQYKEIEEKMNKTLDALYREFGTIRAGKASPSVLDRVTVDYYGAATPIQQLHNGIDLILGALPVFGRKGIDGQIAQSQFVAVFYDSAKRLCALAVTVFPGQSSFLCPAPIAVHDDADVL